MNHLSYTGWTNLTMNSPLLGSGRYEHGRCFSKQPDSVSAPPSETVLRRFRVQMIKPLGGRINRHWLVDRHGTRLVLRLWRKEPPDIDYEVHLLKELNKLGYPVAPVIEGISFEGATWCLFPYIVGEFAPKDDAAVQRLRGRLLAEFHAYAAKLPYIRQRMNWRRCAALFSDPTLDGILVQHEMEKPNEVRIMRRHLERARERIRGLELGKRTSTIVHGDFNRWNLLFHGRRLNGVLDFEHAHLDDRVADLAISWRGKYDEVIRGYHESSPLEPVELEILTPIWWMFLIQTGCVRLAQGIWDDGWIIKSLLERSPLMGPDARYPAF